MVGTHNDKDASGYCLRSSRSKNRTNVVHSVRATMGVMRNQFPVDSLWMQVYGIYQLSNG